MIERHEKPIVVQSRQECEIVPEGVSCTETNVAWYIRIRTEDAIRTVRIQKNKWLLFSTSLEKRPIWKKE